MNLNKLHRIHLLGIGGIGMSALARYFNSKGVEVSGYDLTQTKLTQKLQSEGIDIHFQDDTSKLPAHIDLVIYTPAIPNDLKEFIHLKNSGIPLMKRSEVLGLLTTRLQTIAVAGTHGKTTVSSMIAHLLYNSEIGCTAFLGGLIKNYDTNLLDSDQPKWMVAEADEFDKSFLKIHPDMAVITATDADHLDIYETIDNLHNSFGAFTLQLKENGILILNKKAEIDTTKLTNRKIYKYSLDQPSDFYAENIVINNNIYWFDLVTPDKTIKKLELGISGLINVENAVAALAIAILTGITEQEIRQALASFKGINRRFDIQFNEKNVTYIDDYAHHPEEIKATINSVQNMYPGKKTIGIFQPHLYSRTHDFAREFAKSLELLDTIILLPIYPAREKPIPGVTSELIFNYIKKKDKFLCSMDEVIDLIAKRDFEILLTMGAGNIDRLVDPINKYLIKTTKNELQ